MYIYFTDIAVDKPASQFPEPSDPTPHPASNALSGDDQCTDDYSQTDTDGASYSWWSVYLRGTCIINKVTVAAKGIVVSMLLFSPLRYEIKHILIICD